MSDRVAKTRIKVTSFLCNKNKHMKWYLCKEYYDFQKLKENTLIQRGVTNKRNR